MPTLRAPLRWKAWPAHLFGIWITSEECCLTTSVRAVPCRGILDAYRSLSHRDYLSIKFILHISALQLLPLVSVIQKFNFFQLIKRSGGSDAVFRTLSVWTFLACLVYCPSPPLHFFVDLFWRWCHGSRIWVKQQPLWCKESKQDPAGVQTEALMSWGITPDPLLAPGLFTVTPGVGWQLCESYSYYLSDPEWFSLTGGSQWPVLKYR